MAEQSFLAKAGLRLGLVGSAASLAIAAPLAANNYNPSCHSDAARIGWYFDRTVGAEQLGMVVGGTPALLIYFGNPSTTLNYQVNSPSPVCTVGDGTGVITTVLNATVTTRNYKMVTNSVNRLSVACTQGAESGSDAGSGLNIAVCTADDGSTPLGIGISINRALPGATSSTISIGRPFLAAGGTFTTDIKAFTSTPTWNFANAYKAFRMSVTDTLSTSSSLLLDVQTSTVSKMSVRKDGVIVHRSTDDPAGNQLVLSRTATLTGALTSSGAHVVFSCAINGAFTITRYDWIELDNPTGAATITDATVFYFNAAAGTHKCIDAGTTKTSPGTVTAWVKFNINGTIYYGNCYSSKTS